MISLGWNDFKAVLLNKDFKIQYVELSNIYIILGVEEGFMIDTRVKKTNPANIDQIDFETNYKTTANKNLSPAKDENRRLIIATGVTPPPTNSNPITTAADSVIPGNAFVDTFISITNGKIMSLQVFNGGGESRSSGHTIELFHDPNGDLSILNSIAVAFISDSGGNFNFDLNEEFVGDGVARLIIRRSRNGGGSARIVAFLRGYEK